MKTDFPHLSTHRGTNTDTHILHIYIYNIYHAQKGKEVHAHAYVCIYMYIYYICVYIK